MTWSICRFCDPRAEGKKSLIIFQSLLGMVSPILCKWLSLSTIVCVTLQLKADVINSVNEQLSQPTNRSTGCFSKVFFTSYFALDEALRVGLFDNSTYKTNDSIIPRFMNDEKLLYFSSYSVLNGCTINLNGCFWIHVLSRKGEQPLCCNFGRSCIFLSKYSLIKVP